MQAAVEKIPIADAFDELDTERDYYQAKRKESNERLISKKGMIGKGKRSKEVLDAVIRNGCVYFAAVGGAGAILSKCIKSSEVVAYDDLGTEAIRKLYVEDFPCIVVIDSEGKNLYETAIKEYCNEN